jgi:lysylphosphatidylglycerol synthetase-like protein (DUF2156 family)
LRTGIKRTKKGRSLRVFGASASVKDREDPQMFLPPQYLWLEPVIIAAIIVFVIDLIGNSISFSSRFANALVTAIVFAIVFGVLVYFGYGNVSMSVRTTPSAGAPASK